MTATPTHSSLNAMRSLALQLDEMVEGILDAHGFQLVDMTATAAGTTVRFTAGNDNAWELSLQSSTDREMTVELRRRAENSHLLTLTLAVGEGKLASCAKGVGLAVSVMGFADQAGLAI